MIELSQLRKEADRLLAAAEPFGAIRALVALLQRIPSDYSARIALADALARAGHPGAAATVYRASAELCIAGGLPLPAIVAIRALDAMELAHERETVDRLIARAAETYCKESPHIGPIGARLNVHYPPGASVPTKELRAEISVEALVSLAERIGVDLSTVGNLPPRFQPTALLGQLNASQLAATIRALRVHRLPAQHELIRRGDRGTSCFLVASGSFRVSAPDDLGQLRELATLSMGTLVGEMALITGSKRLATVTSLEAADVLELGHEALAAMGDALDQLAPILDQMAQHRWMKNLLEQSPFFRVFDRDERQAILKRCSAYEVPTGIALFEQGREVKGIYLLMRGEVAIERLGGSHARSVLTTTLSAGATLGVYENLTDEPADANATTQSPSTLLFLSKTAVQRLFKAVPAFKEQLKEIARKRVRDIQLAEASSELLDESLQDEGDTLSDEGA